jgi:rhamnose transport system permease protein
MRSVVARLARWEALLGALFVSVAVFAASSVPNFTSSFNLSQAAAGVSEKALLVLPLALLIIAREIDLSVASILALSSVVLGVLLRAGVPVTAAILIVLLVGVTAGAVNGWLVVRLGLPSLVVTLGTLALFRGLAYIILGSASVNVLPESLSSFGIDPVPGTQVPQTLLPFLVLAPVVAVVLHRTPTGRRIFAIGGNPETALYSGVRVARIRFFLFVFSGLVCAIAGIVYTARLANARADNALGYELDAITVVLLGGVSVFGGRGTLPGVVLALGLVAVVRNVLGLEHVGGDAQGTVIGLLLIVSLLASNLARRVSDRVAIKRALARRPGGAAERRAAVASSTSPFRDVSGG